jgi:hypothetical protein
MTRSKLFEQVKYVACGNTYFAKGSAASAIIVASAGSKKIQTCATSAGEYEDYASLDAGVNNIDLSGAKAYLKTSDSGAVAILGDFATDPVSNS